MRSVALLALTFTVLLTSTAHAWQPVAENDAARLAAFEPIARAGFPQSPCLHRETVYVGVDMASLTGRDTDGHANPATCEVWLAAGMESYQFCLVLVHEFGHLAGLEHNDTPGDIMNPSDPTVGYPPCDYRMTPPLGLQIRDEIRADLPAPRTAWRIACTPRRHGRQRCAAHRPGAHIRRYQAMVHGETFDLVGGGWDRSPAAR